MQSVGSRTGPRPLGFPKSGVSPDRIGIATRTGQADPDVSEGGPSGRGVLPAACPHAAGKAVCQRIDTDTDTDSDSDSDASGCERG